jgi:predicted PurR-regulated permease PerM
MPVFDENGKKVDIDIDGDFPKLKDLDEISKNKKGKSFLKSIPMTSVIFVAAVVLLLIVAVTLALKVNSLNNEVTTLIKTKKQLDSTQAKLNEVNAEKGKTESGTVFG